MTPPCAVCMSDVVTTQHQLNDDVLPSVLPQDQSCVKPRQRRTLLGVLNHLRNCMATR